jgi:hypothetical protein
MLRCVNNVVMTITPGHQTTGNTCMIWSDESSFMLLPTSGRVYVWRTPKEVYMTRWKWMMMKIPGRRPFTSCTT